MRLLKQLAVLTAVAFGLFSALRAQQRETFAWAPLPVQPNTWVAPNQPIWRLSELLAKHKGQANWSQTVVDDVTLHADYVSMAPGVKTARQFHPDTRAWWIVQDGQIRFSIEGQEPFVASKGYLVQVPYRNVFSMETVGDKPSLRLEVNIAGAKTMYPIDEKPAAMPGFNFVKVRISENAEGSRHDLSASLSDSTSSELVEVLGRTLLLYRPHPTKPKIELPVAKKTKAAGRAKRESDPPPK